METATARVRTSTAANPFLDHVIDGLSRSPKKLSPKYFYDELGSRYFDQICELPEYYLYRTELDMLPGVARQLGELLPHRLSVVEFGAGSLIKIQPLLEQVGQIEKFVPIDISGEHLQQASDQLRERFPSVEVAPVQGDFTQPLPLTGDEGELQLGFFPGSTIGNFEPDAALAFLRNARESLGQGAYLLIGVDTKKSAAILHRAYNDTQGITARFNLNILHRINRELSADMDIEAFEHYAFYNPARSRVEMHLVSQCEQHFTLEGTRIHFAAGESIVTEYSHKYRPEDFRNLAARAGWQTQQLWLAKEGMFSMFLLRAGNGE